ncbi:ATP-binding protein [Evansella cellulosilytica]|uniref:histidine kinase n=1 Tax=Evansella cellulosilytica (strain ATCC 21833 / DSM 2522 / FERM P-1141 / JCM 9156 / N-4) TaxID=649639 RepID=E6TYR1_EVAC2|nr:ATP-binding protein [Evansella cellulosilytica]ADU31246.1 integral membrane sensor signal transduction histidine kinase [Evansella cellulosilytica DSM 2522]
MELFFQYLFQAFIILTPLLFFLTLSNNFQLKGHIAIRLLNYSIYIIIFLLTVQFPISIFSDHVIDFRHIVIFLATLFNGVTIGACLLIIDLISRILYGDTHLLLWFMISCYFIIIAQWLSTNDRSWITPKNFAMISFLFLIPYTIIFLYPINYFSSSEFHIFYSVIIVSPIPIVFIMIAYVQQIELNANLKKDLQKSEQLRLVSELAASIAHEVRNPMTVARGFIQLIHSNSKLTSEEKRYLKLTMSELDRAQLIITDYLSLAKPADKATKQIQIYSIIYKVLHTIEAYALMNNVKVKMDVQEDITIIGNEQKLTQVILNLTKNGIEAMENGGELIINGYREREKIILSIKDTGIGMSKEQLQQIGKAYYSTKTNGTGLGLMVSYSIIESLGGAVSVKSEIGQGTEFILTFSH